MLQLKGKKNQTNKQKNRVTLKIGWIRKDSKNLSLKYAENAGTT